MGADLAFPVAVQAVAAHKKAVGHGDFHIQSAYRRLGRGGGDGFFLGVADGQHGDGAAGQLLERQFTLIDRDGCFDVGRGDRAGHRRVAG